MGSGNNLGLKNIKTDYAFILNPDVVLYSNTIDEIINAQNNLESFFIGGRDVNCSIPINA